MILDLERQPAAPNVWRLGMVAGLAVVTFVVFAPGLWGDFVNWDDDVNIVQNEHFRGLASHHLRWMFTTFWGGHYQPLSWLSFGVDYSLWGLRPLGYHLTNVLLHVVTVVLFYFVVLRLLVAASRWREEGEVAGVHAADDVTRGMPLFVWAGIGAALFGLHPLRVESVTWVTERRDVLSGALVMACLLAYLRSVDCRGGVLGWLCLSFVLFGAALLSKASAMGLPIVLLVLDLYPLGRLRRGRGVSWGRLLVEKVPFGILSCGVAFLAMCAQRSAGAWRSWEDVDLLSRVARACYGFWFYIFKSLMPNIDSLSPLYRMPLREELVGVTFFMSALGLVAVFVAAWRLRRVYPGVLAALVCYVVLLAPMSGLAQSGKQLVADRYSYLSMMPFAVLWAGGLVSLYARASQGGLARRWLKICSYATVAFLCAVALLTAARTTVWRDSVSLWRSALKADSNRQVVDVNLAEAYRLTKNYKMAEVWFRRACERSDRDAKALNGWGITLFALGKPQEALPVLERAVWLEPDNAKYLCNLGYVYAGFGMKERAADSYARAVELAPGLTVAVKQLGALLVGLKRYEEAKQVLENGLRLASGDRGLRGDLAWLLATCPDDAVRDGDRAVTLGTGLAKETGFSDPWVLDMLAVAYAEAGRFDDAVRMATRAIQLAEDARQADLVTQLEARIERFGHLQPWREGG